MSEPVSKGAKLAARLLPQGATSGRRSSKGPANTNSKAMTSAAIQVSLLRTALHQALKVGLVNDL
jgi:hypothetical protein